MKEKRTKMTDLLALLVFAMFAVCVIAVLLTGAKVYRNVVDRGEAQFEARTAVQYVTTHVRQAETVEITDFEGCEALTMPQTIDGEVYLTRIYCYGGFLRELFCAEDAVFAPADGEEILPAESLQLSIEGYLLAVQLDGQEILLYLGGKEAAP